jgi:hypothetical protein
MTTSFAHVTFRTPCVADQLANDSRASADGGQLCPACTAESSRIGSGRPAALERPRSARAGPDAIERRDRTGSNGMHSVLHDAVFLGDPVSLLLDLMALCRARTRTMALSWYFLRSSGRSPILVDQPVDDLPTPDPAGDVDRLTGLMQRRSLFARLVRTMFVCNAVSTRPGSAGGAARRGSGGGRGTRAAVFPHTALRRSSPGATGPAS